MARVRRVRNAAVVPPAKCKRAILRLFDVVLQEPEERWRKPSYTGDLCYFDEYHARIAWRLREQGTRYCVELDEELLLRVHARVHALANAWAIEDALWIAVVRISSAPLPREIALAVVDSGYFLRLALATSEQHPDVYWAAARADKQARNRLAHRVMAEERFSAADVARFIDEFGYAALTIMRRVRDTTEDKRALLARR